MSIAARALALVVAAKDDTSGPNVSLDIVLKLLATQLAEVDRLTRELAARNAEVTGWAKHCANLESDVERAHELVVSYIAVHDERTAELAERTRERDDARVAVCERAALGRPGHESEHDFDEPDDAAEHFGWPDLYSNPEEP